MKLLLFTILAASGCLKSDLIRFPVSRNQKPVYFSEQELKRASIFAQSFPGIVFYVNPLDSNLIFQAFVEQAFPADSTAYRESSIDPYAYMAQTRIFQDGPRTTPPRNLVFEIQFFDRARGGLMGTIRVIYLIGGFW